MSYIRPIASRTDEVSATMSAIAPDRRPVDQGIGLTAEPAGPRIDAHRRGAYRSGAKRVLDVVLVLLSAPIVLPVVALLALLVMLDGGGPFYVQRRVGRGGRIFRMWKLRTMTRDADSMLRTLLQGDPSARAEWDCNQKLRRDPRITAVGRILRQSSLDELPQLWNVLTGEMSLVGPRPMLPEQRPLYPGRSYYRLRPGLTGPWQISDRHLSSFAARAVFDGDYDRSLSLRTDLGILCATVRVMLRGTGC